MTHTYANFHLARLKECVSLNVAIFDLVAQFWRKIEKESSPATLEFVARIYLVTENLGDTPVLYWAEKA